MRARPPHRACGQRQMLLDQIGPHRPGASELGELGKDERETRAHFLVWSEDHGAIALTV